MKELNYKELIAYAQAFISFVFSKIDGVNEIILFGSVARKESGKESDIDLFFDIANKTEEEQIKNILNLELNRFYKSKSAEFWILKGIKNPINFNVGILEEWKLKRSIISDGITLYSKYKETPKNLKDFVFFNFEPIKNITKRNFIIRKLFGRKEKNFSTKGIVEMASGKRLSTTSFIVPKEKANELIKFLGKEKINYKFFELWTDQII